MSSSLRIEKFFKYLEDSTPVDLKKYAVNQICCIVESGNYGLETLMDHLSKYLYCDSWTSRHYSSICVARIFKIIKKNQITQKGYTESSELKIIFNKIFENFDLIDALTDKKCSNISKNYNEKRKKNDFLNDFSQDFSENSFIDRDNYGMLLYIEAHISKYISIYFQSMEQIIKKSNPYIPSNITEKNTIEYYLNEIITNIFDNNWQKRHGSICALTQIVTTLNFQIGRFDEFTLEINNFLNTIYLFKINIYIWALLFIENLYDYYGSLAVAPVLETSCQLFIILIPILDTKVDYILKNIQYIIDNYQGDWKIVYSSLTLLKFLMKIEVKENVLNSFLISLTNTIIDENEDIVASCCEIITIIMQKLKIIDMEKNIQLIKNLIHIILNHQNFYFSVPSALNLLTFIISMLDSNSCEKIFDLFPSKILFIDLLNSIFFLSQDPDSSIYINAFYILSQFFKIYPLKIIIANNIDLFKHLIFTFIFFALTENSFETSSKIKETYLSFLEYMQDCPIEIFFDIIITNFTYFMKYPSHKVLNTLDSKSSLSKLKIRTALVGGSLNQKIQELYDSDIFCRVTCCELLISTILKLLKKNELFTINRWHIHITQQFNLKDLDFKWCFLYTTNKIFQQNKATEKYASLINYFQTELNTLMNYDIYDPKTDSQTKAVLFIKLLKRFNELENIIINNQTSENNFSYAKIRNLFSLSSYYMIKVFKSDNTESFQKFLEELVSYRKFIRETNLKCLPFLFEICCTFQKIPEKISSIVFGLIDLMILEPVNFFKESAISTLVNLIKVTLNRQKPPYLRILSNLRERIIYSSRILREYRIDIFHRICNAQTEDFIIDLRSGVYGNINILNQDKSKLNEDNILEEIFNVFENHKTAKKAFQQIFAFFKDSKIINNLVDIYFYLPENKTENSDDICNILILYLETVDTLSSIIFKNSEKYIYKLVSLLNSQYTMIRYLAAKCISLSLHLFDKKQYIEIFYQNIYKMFEDEDCEFSRLGVSDLLLSIIYENHNRNIPNDFMLKISKHLMLPILRRINDVNSQISYASSYCFSKIIFFLQLTGDQDHVDYQDEMSVKNISMFNNLFYPSSIPPYNLNFDLPIKLREYQMFGISWLHFLKTLNLNAALCDDMGLGKTLQSLCVIADDHIIKKNISSLIVCPSILMNHWKSECSKFIPKNILNPYLIRFKKSEECLAKIKSHQNDDLLITSYDQLKKHIKFFSAFDWNYLILDEAHVIKNVKSKIFKSSKILKARHKLVLTGTPIQNGVMELWAIFDFLMPSFLGSYYQFKKRYSDQISKTKSSKCSDIDILEGVKLLDSLHKRCLPFILRRMKSDVLNDLPPKIIQNIFCSLSPIQQMIYKFYSSQDFEEFALSIKKIDDPINNQPFIKIIHSLRKICAHLSYVVSNPNDERFLPLLSGLNIYGSSNNCKLRVLKEILELCGFKRIEINDIQSIEEKIYPHKVIIFCQLRQTVKIIEQYLLIPDFSFLHWLKLDGSVNSDDRYDIINKFNNDSSSDILITTTSIGGLGLNLSSADTVIFYDIDWNPMKDLQAMDRAYRIGQRRTVNVFKIICKNTIEERILHLQEQKTKIIETVVSTENVAPKMDQIIDLMQYENEINKKNSKSNNIENWKDLDDEYDTYLNLDSFFNKYQKFEKSI